MYISMSYSLTYGLSFAAVTSIVFYTYLYSGKEIWAKFKDAKHGGEDIHKRLMSSYKEVPDWWYGVLTLVVLGLGIFTCRYWDTQLPVWGFIVVCFGMGLVLIVPEGILEGTTNQRSESCSVCRWSCADHQHSLPEYHYRVNCGLCLAWETYCQHARQVLRL